MKIVLYARRNTGMACLAYLKGRGHKVIVISDDKDVLWMAKALGCSEIKLYHLPYHPHDLFICIHGDKIIPKEHLHINMVNLHPTKYNGHNPVKKFINNGDTDGCVRAIKMIEEVDAGDLLHQENFEVPLCQTYAEYYNVALPHYFKTLEKLGV
jgi:hypothetical protein